MSLQMAFKRLISTDNPTTNNTRTWLIYSYWAYIRSLDTVVLSQTCCLTCRCNEISVADSCVDELDEETLVYVVWNTDDVERVAAAQTAVVTSSAITTVRCFLTRHKTFLPKAGLLFTSNSVRAGVA